MRAAAALVLVLAAPAAAGPLEAALAPPKTAFHGRKVVLTWFGDKSRARDVRVSHLPPDRWRHDTLGPDGSVVRTALRDGEREWVFDPAAHTVYARDLRAAARDGLSAGELRTLLKENFDVKELGAETYLGIRAVGVELAPHGPSKARRALWVDPETGVVLRRRLTNHKGAFVRESHFLDIAYEAPPKDLFAFDLPKGWELRRRDDVPETRAGEVPPPRAIPLGYRLDAARVIHVSGTPVRHYRYTNGLGILSLFVSPHPIATDAGASPGGDEEEEEIEFLSAWAGNVLTWTEGGNHLLLVGDHGAAEMQRVRQALAKSAP